MVAFYFCVLFQKQRGEMQGEELFLGVWRLILLFGFCMSSQLWRCDLRSGRGAKFPFPAGLIT